MAGALHLWNSSVTFDFGGLMRCPTCKRPVDPSAANQFRPFCSERCRLADLGQWAGETYRVTGGKHDDHEHPDDRDKKKISH